MNFLIYVIQKLIWENTFIECHRCPPKMQMALYPTLHMTSACLAPCSAAPLICTQNSTSSCSPSPSMQRSPVPLAPLDHFSILGKLLLLHVYILMSNHTHVLKKTFLESPLNIHSRSSHVLGQPDLLSYPIYPCVIHVLISSFPALRTDIVIYGEALQSSSHDTSGVVAEGGGVHCRHPS